MSTPAEPPAVIWQDVECGAYRADLPLWRELAERERGPVLDVGAGTGRVALDLAAHGHRVLALDREPELIAALAARARARGLRVSTTLADAAAGFDLAGARFGLVIVPMQTVQLFPGPPARARFFVSVRRHLHPGGLLAAALADALEGYEAGHEAPPPPDRIERDGWRYVSQPVAVRQHTAALRIERIRRTLSPDGVLTAEGDAVELARVTVADLEAEARAAAGLVPEPPREVPETDDHVGSRVVILRG